MFALLLAAISLTAVTDADLSFLSGDWRQCAADGFVEERWLGPREGLAVGANLTVRNGKATFEHLRIARETDGWTYWASPSGKPPVPFKLVELADKRAVFANPAHGFPPALFMPVRATSWWRKSKARSARRRAKNPGASDPATERIATNAEVAHPACMTRKVTATSNQGDFRELALACEGAVEGAHMGHADFRVMGRVFASLGYPDDAWGMVKLTADEQGVATTDRRSCVQTRSGCVGTSGLDLGEARSGRLQTLEEAIAAAWVHVAAKKANKTKKALAKKKR